MSQETGWQLPSEYVALQDTVRDFMAREVRPAEDKVEFDAIKAAARRPR